MAMRLLALRAGQPPFTPRKIPGTHLVRGCADPRAMVRLEGLGKLKNPIISSGIEPATYANIYERMHKNGDHIEHYMEFAVAYLIFKDALNIVTV
jgi:hypothetical protein